jgi:hypothetical protein
MVPGLVPLNRSNVPTQNANRSSVFAAACPTACTSSKNIDAAVYKLYASARTTCPSPNVRVYSSNKATMDVAEDMHWIRGFCSAVEVPEWRGSRLSLSLARCRRMLIVW